MFFRTVFRPFEENIFSVKCTSLKIEKKFFLRSYFLYSKSNQRKKIPFIGNCKFSWFC